MIYIILFKLTLAYVFIGAAIPKILNPSLFAKDIEGYQVIPVSMTHIIALGLPFLELFLVLFLFIPKISETALIWFGLLLLLFTCLLSHAWLTGKEINCGCFGGDSKVGINKIIMDLMLLIGIIPCFIWQKEITKKYTSSS